eukprot:313895-Rhodomonas_salina.2
MPPEKPKNKPPQHTHTLLLPAATAAVVATLLALAATFVSADAAATRHTKNVENEKQPQKSPRPEGNVEFSEWAEATKTGIQTGTSTLCTEMRVPLLEPILDVLKNHLSSSQQYQLEGRKLLREIEHQVNKSNDVTEKVAMLESIRKTREMMSAQFKPWGDGNRRRVKGGKKIQNDNNR